MSLSSVSVISNALRLRRVDLLTSKNCYICQYAKLRTSGACHHHHALVEGQHSFFAQFAQYPVDVNGTEPQCIGQEILRQAAGIALLVSQPHQPQPLSQFQQEMRCAFGGIAPPQIDQMFYHHGFIA